MDEQPEVDGRDGEAAARGNALIIASRVVALVLMAGAMGCAGRVRVESSRAACPSPRLSTRDWVTVSDPSGVSFQLPPNFHEHTTGTANREWFADGDNQQYIALGFIASSNPPTSLGRFVSPGMLEMSQCIESVDSRETLVQAWRTVGGTFRNSQRMDRYDVFAVVPVSATSRVYLMSGSYKRGTQDVALAAVRTMSVRAR